MEHISAIECQETNEVFDGTSLEMIDEAQNIFKSCNNNFLKTKKGKTGEEAEIIIDLKCPVRLERFSIINGFGNFGTKKFILFGARNISSKWKQLYAGELLIGNEMTEEVSHVFKTLYLFHYFVQDILCCNHEDPEENESTTVTMKPETVETTNRGTFSTETTNTFSEISTEATTVSSMAAKVS